MPLNNFVLTFRSLVPTKQRNTHNFVLWVRDLPHIIAFWARWPHINVISKISGSIGGGLYLLVRRLCSAQHEFGEPTVCKLFYILSCFHTLKNWISLNFARLSRIGIKRLARGLILRVGSRDATHRRYLYDLNYFNSKVQTYVDINQIEWRNYDWRLS